MPQDSRHLCQSGASMGGRERGGGLFFFPFFVPAGKHWNNLKTTVQDGLRKHDSRFSLLEATAWYQVSDPVSRIKAFTHQM